MLNEFRQSLLNPVTFVTGFFIEMPKKQTPKNYYLAITPH